MNSNPVNPTPMADTNLSDADDESRLVRVFQKQVEFLRSVPIFKNLEDIDLGRLCQVATVRRYPADSVLLPEGQMNDALYLIEHGTVELSSRRTNGEPFLRLGHGRFFGQVSMFDPAASSATVTARTNVEVMVLRERPLCGLLVAYPEVGVRLLAAIIRDMARRHHTMIKRLRELAPSDMEHENS